MDLGFFSNIYQEELLMQSQTLHKLLQDLEQELLRLGYTKGSMTFYRNRWRKLEDFAKYVSITSRTTGALNTAPSSPS